MTNRRDGTRHCALCWHHIHQDQRLCPTCRASLRNAALMLLAIATIASWWAYFATH